MDSIGFLLKASYLTSLMPPNKSIKDSSLKILLRSWSDWRRTSVEITWKAQSQAVSRYIYLQSKSAWLYFFDIKVCPLCWDFLLKTHAGHGQTDEGAARYLQESKFQIWCLPGDFTWTNCVNKNTVGISSQNPVPVFSTLIAGWAGERLVVRVEREDVKGRPGLFAGHRPRHPEGTRGQGPHPSLLHVQGAPFNFV